MPNHLTGRVIRHRRILVVLSLALALFVSPALAQSPARLVAIGDIHGDYDAFVAILQQAGLIDAKLSWTGKDATLVQTGDMLDRGAKCREVMDLLMKLEREAPRNGGRVVVLLGNHEAMNIIGDLRYAEAMYPSFADKSSEKLRKAAYDAYMSWYKARAAAGMLPTNAAAPPDEAAWMAAHPLGYFEQREAMSTEGKYGHWLRERPAVAKIGTTLFVHGGISSELNGWTPDKIVERVHNEVAQFDHLMRVFVRQKTALPNFNLEEATAAVSAELAHRNAELAQKSAEAQQKGAKPPQFSETEKRQVEELSNFLGYNGWFIVHPSGPLWFRGYAQWNDEEGKLQIAKVLESLGVSQIVVGHTPQKDGRIAARFDGKVFLIDTGMLSSYFPSGRASALEISAGKYTAIYPDQRVVLLDASAHQGATPAPASHEDQVFEEVPGGGLEQQAQNPPAKEPAPAAAKDAAPAPIVWYDPDGKPLPFKTKEEIMDFLRTADITTMKDIPTGVAHPRKALLVKDGIRANAKFSDIHEDKAVAELASGQREFNFRDDAIFDLAAQEVAWMLGMDCLPPAVQRYYKGDKGILQIWVENSMTEKDRQKQALRPPDALRWNHQVATMRLFDNLIYNEDRNMGNILIDKQWKVWLIDHTRAFRRSTDLQSVKNINEVDRAVWEKLQAMDDADLRQRLKPYLRAIEIDSLIKRKQELIDFIKEQISKHGEDAVLFSSN